ncbi:MAG: hypothetical protein ACRDQA_23035 [Nocardioidaceae bacterium]
MDGCVLGQGDHLHGLAGVDVDGVGEHAVLGSGAGPYKDLFFSDLLRELATAAGAGTLPVDTATADLMRRVATEHLD